MFDALGNLYVADGTSNAVLQILLVSSPLVSAILPGSRSVQVGTPATVFSTIINTGSAALNNCRAFLPGTAPTALSIEFQTTDPHYQRADRNEKPVGEHRRQRIAELRPRLQRDRAAVVAVVASRLCLRRGEPAPTSPGVNTWTCCSRKRGADIIAWRQPRPGTASSTCRLASMRAAPLR